MTEHMHEWYWNDQLGVFTCIDLDCLEDLRPAWAVRRLNAMERLSARRAKMYAETLQREGLGPMKEELLAYAAALEGTDEKS